MIKVQAGSSFVEENSNSLDEKNVGKESFEPVDDGRNPWRGRWAAEVRDSLRRHGFVALTKLDFSGKEIFTLTQFFYLHHHLR